MQNYEKERLFSGCLYLLSSEGGVDRLISCKVPSTLLWHVYSCRFLFHIVPQGKNKAVVSLYAPAWNRPSAQACLHTSTPILKTCVSHTDQQILFIIISNMNYSHRLWHIQTLFVFVSNILCNHSH